MLRRSKIPEAMAASPELSLEQVLAFISRLDSAARSRVAQALADCEMDARLERLISRLANRRPADEISDADVQNEVGA